MKKLFLLFFVLFGACGKLEENIILEIFVYNDRTQLLSDAQIKLYASEQDWQAERNPVVEQVTDEQGKTVFDNLKTGDYWIDAQQGTQTNWELTQQLNLQARGEVFLRTQFLILTENISTILSSAKGKRWKLTEINTFPTIPIPTCEIDDEWVFFKGKKTGKVTRLLHQSCGGSPETALVWEWKADNLLEIRQNDGTVVESWTISDWTQNSFLRNQTVFLNGGVIQIVAKYEKQP